jgi:hypothetical protein
MNEQEYRALPIDSYSSLKVFAEDRKKYYRKFVLGEPIKEEETNSLKLGSLVDCLLFTPSDFDDRFTLAISQVPKGQYGKFVEELMKITLRSTDENGRVNRELESMMEDAYNAVKFDRDGSIIDFKRDTFETVKAKFFGTEVELYYKQLRDSHGKTVIEMSTLEAAQAVVNELKTNFVTRDIINATSSPNFKVLKQFPIVGQISSTITKSIPYDVKVLPDLIHINHDKKVIYLFDLKTAWDNEGEFHTNYLKYKYYLQGALYFYLLVEWKNKQKGMEDYMVNFPAFIVAESSNYKNPLIYTTNLANFNQGMRGFNMRGRYNPGIIKIVQDIMWHREMGIWNISKENYLNDGVIPIKPFE